MLNQIMAQLQSEIVTLVGTILAAGLMWVLKHLVGVLKVKKETEALILKSDIVKQAVQFVQKKFSDAGGQAKFEIASTRVADVLKQKGINVDSKEIEHLIEQAVHSFELEFGAQWKQEISQLEQK